MTKLEKRTVFLCIISFICFGITVHLQMTSSLPVQGLFRSYPILFSTLGSLIIMCYTVGHIYFLDTVSPEQD